MSKPNGYNEEFHLEIHEGRYYRTREGKVVGPLKRAPNLLAKPSAPSVWYWCAGRDGNDRLYWTIDGRWYEKHGKPSPHDLAQELGKDEIYSTDELLHPQDREETQVKISTSVPAPARMTKRALLEAAIVATTDRGLNYGKPEDNFARIAAHWSAYLANSVRPAKGPLVITPTDVALMCALLKIARLENDPRHQDSWVDLAGYAACGAEIALKGTGSSTEQKSESKTEFKVHYSEDGYDFKGKHS